MDITSEHRKGEITVFVNSATPEVQLTTRREEAKATVNENDQSIITVAENIESVKDAAKYVDTFDDVIASLPQIMEAATAAERAEKAKVDAFNAKDEAVASASVASSSSSAALVSAKNAETSEKKALASEQSALNSANSASASKTAAQNSALLAAESATSAKQDLDSIKADAEMVAEYAPKAIEAAEKAEIAKASAISAAERAEQASQGVEGALSGKQDKLTAGEGIKIEGNVISTEGGKLPDNVYTEDNLVAGENVTFDKKSGTDDNTIALFHFDGNAKDVVSGKELSESPVIATEGKFGTGSLKARENWFNSVSFAKSIDPKTTPFTLEFWHKQVKGSTAGTWGDETTIVLAPTAPNNTASKSQWVGLFMLPDGTNNKIQLQIGDSRLGEFRTNNYTTLGEYNHYALTWDPSTQYFKLYMNGTYVDQYQYYYYSSLPVLGGIGMFKYTTGTDDNTVAQAYIDELRFSDTVRYTGNFTVATEAFPSDKLKTVVNVNVPESGFNKDNLLGGKDIEIIPEPVEGGIDEHTVACWHFDDGVKDSVAGLALTQGTVSILTDDYKFGTGAGQARSSNYNNNITTLGLNPTKSVTLDFWAKATSSNAAIKIGFFNGSGSSASSVLHTTISQKQVELYGKVWATSKTLTDIVPSNIFNHYVLQFDYDKQQVSFYFNGKKIVEEAVASTLSSSDFTYLKASEYYGAGRIDEMRISDVARYNGDFTPPTQAYRVAKPTGRYQVNYTGESGAGKNIGEVYYSQSNSATDNAGALPLFTGETITSANTIYPEFYSWVESHTELQATAEEYETALSTYGECPKYVISDGSLRLPKLTNYVKMANTAEGITQKGAGLPNITGESDLAPNAGLRADSTVKGAFYKKEVTGYAPNFVGASGNSLGFDASLSSEVYGNSDTVTPSHTTLYPWVFAYSAVIPASAAQASEFQEGLSGKADTNLDNIPSNYDYVVESYSDGEGNWYRVYKSGWIEQGCSSTNNAFTTNTTITYLKPFANNSYMLAGPIFVISNAGAQTLTEKTATGFTTSSVANVTGTSWWYACGQGA